MKKTLSYAFTSLIIIAIAVALFQARNWNSITGLFPKVVGFPMLGLSIAILAVDVIKGIRKNKSEDEETAKSFSHLVKTSLILMGWLIGFILVIWAIGIIYAIPIYVFAYMKVQGKYSWIKSAIFAIAAGAVIFIIFNLIFEVVWPQGVIPRFLGF